MKRNLPNRTLMSKDTFTMSTQPTIAPEKDFCPIQQKRQKRDPSAVEILLDRYKALSMELQSIRGQLYRVGIDPDK